MYRRSLVVLAKRTVVRDPRKRAASGKIVPLRHVESQVPQDHQPQQHPLSIAPPPQPPSTGASLGFYLIAGVGVSLGFALVGAVLG